MACLGKQLISTKLFKSTIYNRMFFNVVINKLSVYDHYKTLYYHLLCFITEDLSLWVIAIDYPCI